MSVKCRFGGRPTPEAEEDIEDYCRVHHSYRIDGSHETCLWLEQHTGNFSLDRNWKRTASEETAREDRIAEARRRAGLG